MRRVRTRVDGDGRIHLPKRLCRAAGLTPGDFVEVFVEDDGIRVMTPENAMLRGQTAVVLEDDAPTRSPSGRR